MRRFYEGLTWSLFLLLSRVASRFSLSSIQTCVLSSIYVTCADRDRSCGPRTRPPKPLSGRQKKS